MATNIKSYNLKLYPNKEKAKAINQLLAFWHREVNKKISVFWKMEDIKKPYPPKEYRQKGRLISNASLKAWQIAKVAKAVGQKKKPTYKFGEIDLNESSAKQIEGLTTKMFDCWFNIISLEKYNRLKLPAKKTGILNKALQAGILRKSFKLKARGKGRHRQYYMTVFVEFYKPVKQVNSKRLGIDVGLDNPIATSDGRLIGQDLKDLRIRTKWRTYGYKISPYKQMLNKEVKQLIADNPNTDFVVEQLIFKGKKGRSRAFRRNNKNWAYKHVSKQLNYHSVLEGFRVFEVNPAYTSVTCSVCGFADKANRAGSVFNCQKCHHESNADINAAVNIRKQYERVAWDFSAPINKMKTGDAYAN